MKKGPDAKAVVKKVSPYPMAVKMTDLDGTVLSGQILKLTPTAMMVEVRSLAAKIGKIYNVEFTLKLTEKSFNEKARVVKTYDRMHTSVPQDAAEPAPAAENPQAAQQSSKIFRLAELHFSSIGLEERKWIRDFILKIHQPPEKP